MAAVSLACEVTAITQFLRGNPKIYSCLSETIIFVRCYQSEVWESGFIAPRLRQNNTPTYDNNYRFANPRRSPASCADNNRGNWQLKRGKSNYLDTNE